MKYQPPVGATDENAAYVNADPANGIAGSVPSAEAIEHPMREIIAVIEAADLTPDEDDLGQMATAINTLISNNTTSVNDASKKQKGIIQIATNDEAKAGSAENLAITPATLDGVLALIRMPAGTVIIYAATTVPDGFLICDGATISRTTYAGLYNIIGTTYGAGDGETTFALPDWRDMIPRGYNSGDGFGVRQEATTSTHSHSSTIADEGRDYGYASVTTTAATTIDVPPSMYQTFCIKY